MFTCNAKTCRSSAVEPPEELDFLRFNFCGDHLDYLSFVLEQLRASGDVDPAYLEHEVSAAARKLAYPIPGVPTLRVIQGGRRDDPEAESAPPEPGRGAPERPSASAEPAGARTLP